MSVRVAIWFLKFNSIFIIKNLFYTFLGIFSIEVFMPFYIECTITLTTCIFFS